MKDELAEIEKVLDRTRATVRMFIITGSLMWAAFIVTAAFAVTIK